MPFTRPAPAANRICTAVLASALTLAGCGDSAGDAAHTPPADTGDAAGDAPSADATDTSDRADAAPTDPVAAQAALERVFDALDLNPTDAADLRRVWDDAELFAAYIAQWQVDRGVAFALEPRNKAECLALTEFDSTVPYCGPGCGNSVTLAPPCLNRGCFEHDACYAALECRSGESIGVGLSFSALTACCDAPLAPTRASCAGEVAEGFASGELTLAEAELFAAVSAIMVAIEQSTLLDTPTDRPPGVCDESFEEACAPGVLVASAAPTSVGADGSVEVCATLTRSGRPVGRWNLVPRAPIVGNWSDVRVVAQGENPACVNWTAPTEVPISGAVADLVVDAEVLGEALTDATVQVQLDPELVALRAEGGTTAEVEVGQSRSFCFVAERRGSPAPDLDAAFTLEGAGRLESTTGTTSAEGRACVVYTAPSALPDAVDVVGAAVETAQSSVAITVIGESAAAVRLQGLSAERILGCNRTGDRSAIRVQVVSLTGVPQAGVPVEFALDGVVLGTPATDADGVAETFYDEVGASAGVVSARAEGIEVSATFEFDHAGSRCSPCAGTEITDDDRAACAAPCAPGDSACLSASTCACEYACGDMGYACGCTADFCACCCGCT